METCCPITENPVAVGAKRTLQNAFDYYLSPVWQFPTNLWRDINIGAVGGLKRPPSAAMVKRGKPKAKAGKTAAAATKCNVWRRAARCVFFRIVHLSGLRPSI
jgi:hypothetical protein